MPKAPWQTLNNRRTPTPPPPSPEKFSGSAYADYTKKRKLFTSVVTVYCITCKKYGNDIILHN